MEKSSVDNWFIASPGAVIHQIFAENTQCLIWDILPPTRGFSVPFSRCRYWTFHTWVLYSTATFCSGTHYFTTSGTSKGLLTNVNCSGRMAAFFYLCWANFIKTKTIFTAREHGNFLWNVLFEFLMNLVKILAKSLLQSKVVYYMNSWKKLFQEKFIQ